MSGIDVKNTLNIRNGHKRNIGLNLDNVKLTKRKDQVLNNCVEPELGNHILNCARNIITKQNTVQTDLFT